MTERLPFDQEREELTADILGALTGKSIFTDERYRTSRSAAVLLIDLQSRVLEVTLVNGFAETLQFPFGEEVTASSISVKLRDSQDRKLDEFDPNDHEEKIDELQRVRNALAAMCIHAADAQTRGEEPEFLSALHIVNTKGDPSWILPGEKFPSFKALYTEVSEALSQLLPLFSTDNQTLQGPMYYVIREAQQRLIASWNLKVASRRGRSTDQPDGKILRLPSADTNDQQ